MKDRQKSMAEVAMIQERTFVSPTTIDIDFSNSRDMYQMLGESFVNGVKDALQKGV